MIMHCKQVALSLCFCLLLALIPVPGTAKAESVPAPWKQQNIGSPALAGSASYDPGAGRFEVSGSGTDIWGKSDQFNFVYQPWTGTARSSLSFPRRRIPTISPKRALRSGKR